MAWSRCVIGWTRGDTTLIAGAGCCGTGGTWCYIEKLFFKTKKQWASAAPC